MEALRQIFAPKTEIVTSLPSVSDKTDGDFVVVKDKANFVLYILINGEWKKVTQLQ